MYEEIKPRDKIYWMGHRTEKSILTPLQYTVLKIEIDEHKTIYVCGGNSRTQRIPQEQATKYEKRYREWAKNEVEKEYKTKITVINRYI